jgi:hypothetical protein
VKLALCAYLTLEKSGRKLPGIWSNPKNIRKESREKFSEHPPDQACHPDSI